MVCRIKSFIVKIFIIEKTYAKNMDKFKEFEKFKETFFIYNGHAEYNRENGKSKNSEPYFMRLIQKLAPAPQTNNYCRHFKLEITLENVPKPIAKIIDIKFETLNSVFLVEIKKNIDLVEKDLFKWYLMKTCEWKPKNGKQHKTVELIWEENKMSDNCQYLCLLKYAKSQNWIDDYFYLTKEQESFIEQLKGLEKLINQN